MNYLIRTACAAFIGFSLFACSTGNDRAANIDPRTGKHPADWAAANTGGAHPAAFLSVPSSCYQCHGQDLRGGISSVSCFSASRSGMDCHAAGPSGHPAGWAVPEQHGAHAKSPLAGTNGFARCQTCHGVNFAGGLANKTCLNTAGCHGATVAAPHPAKPWLDLAQTGAARSHSSTDTSNAATCAVCHTRGANSTRSPLPAAPAGTAPGCFNNTLCHGVEGHANGWNVPSAHGVAAKAAAGGVTVNSIVSPVSSLASCTACHGTNYAGGTSLQSCLNNASCHGATVAAPHPAKPWLSSSGGVTHTTTDTENAGQCAVCHTAGANSNRKPVAGSPVGLTGCFDNSLCHGSEGHPVGWAIFSSHGKAAKRVPTAATGFTSCQTCHGSTFNNGTAPSCLNNFGCHGLTVAAPHPVKPWTSTIAGTPTHTTTDTGNVGICAACHGGGANSDLTPPLPLGTGNAGCFNNTLCHFHQVPFAPPGINPSVHGGQAKQDLLICKGCHGSGSNLFSGGAAPTACATCHTFAKAHPTAWQGTTLNPNETVIYSHRTAGNTANACAICHNVTTTSGGPLAGAPSCLSTSFTNGLGINTGCHPGGPGAGPPHAVPYTNHNANALGNFGFCLSCHQVAANGTATPPGCLNCHFTNPTVLTAVVCTTCHGNPPNGTGYPNIAAVHGAHVAAGKVSNIALFCADCHTGLGLATDDHQVRAKARTTSVQANPVVFSNAVIATGGGTAPAFTGGVNGQCTNTYCHGAKMPRGDTSGSNRSPSWGTALLPVSLSVPSCGICHGFPPSTASGHPPVAVPTAFPLGSGCSCHSNVSGTGTSYTTIFVNKALHINGSVEESSSCINCHASIQTGTHGTPRDAVTTEFGLAWGHKKAGRGSVTDADCIVCHLEGDFATQKPSATKHQDGNIDLRDPDGVGETAITDLNNAAFTFTKFAISYGAGSRSSVAANDIPNIVSRKFCLACHDGNGATNTTARSNNGGTGTALMPFGGVNLGAGYTVLNGAAAAGGLVNVAASFATANSSVHPVLGPRTKDFPTQARLAVPYNNFARVGTRGTKTAGVVMNCFDCHNTPTLLTTRTVAAHGNAATIRGTLYAAATGGNSVVSPTFCLACHIGGYNTSAQGHGAGSGITTSDSAMSATRFAPCANCHFSSGSKPARPLQATDVHGFNGLAASGGPWTYGNANGMRPVAFIRNVGRWPSTSPRPFSAPGLVGTGATCGGAMNSSTGGVSCNENMDSYTPGGTY